ncbi:phosphatase PAP2 family protein [Streptomyces sp. NPDC055078]
MLFSLVTWQVAADGPLRSADERAGRHLAGHGPRPLTELLADLGSTFVALPVLAAAVAYALWRSRRPLRSQRSRRPLSSLWSLRSLWDEAAVRVVLAAAALPALIVPLKALIDRPGPGTGAGGYYPSGHTATAMVAYCGAALLIGRYPGRVRRWAMPAAGVLTLATGIGLVLRGYHWPLDVVGSWCLGGMLLLISSSGRRRSSGRTRTG